MSRPFLKNYPEDEKLSPTFKYSAKFMLNEKECTFTPKINDNKKFNDLDKKYPLYDPNYHLKKES